jgi:hypothetical protein
MNCPKCESEMMAGTVHVGGGSVAGLFLTGGIPVGNLTFKAAGWGEHVMMETSGLLPASYCDACGAVVVETGRRGLSSFEGKAVG